MILVKYQLVPNYQLKVIGDLHGDYHYIKHLSEKTNLLQLGDFFPNGHFTLEKGKKVLYKLNRILSARNSYLYIIRGNHDYPFLFLNNKAKLNTYFERMNYSRSCIENTKSDIKYIRSLSNIILVQDYSILEWRDKTIFCLGGATSIDRDKREYGRNWWPFESFEPNDKWLDYINDHFDIDMIATHTAPHIVPPTHEVTIANRYIANDIMEERIYLTSVYDKFKPTVKNWFFGHFHKHKLITHESTKFWNMDNKKLINVY
jgi:DNA repair exonuclease SbcCD nuclease subunit